VLLSEETRQIAFSEGLALAGLPVVSYGMAFLYESAYCQHFAIPRSFISISLTSVFAVFLALASALFLVFLLANLAFAFLYPRAWESPISREIVSLVSVSLLFLGFLLLSRPPRPLIYLGIFGFVLALNLAWPLFTQRGVKGYAAKAEAQAELERQVALGLDHLLRSLTPSARRTLFVVVLALVASHIAGGGEARSQKMLLLLEGTPTRAVLRHYGSLLITAPVNKAEHTVVPSFALVDVGADAKLTLTPEEIGPLSIHHQ
jgi:hypothetical protein